MWLGTDSGTYTQASKQLSTELTQGGARKRVSEKKTRGREARKIEDLKKNQIVARTVLDFAELPESLQSEANACLIGIVFCDMFAGAKNGN